MSMEQIAWNQVYRSMHGPDEQRAFNRATARRIFTFAHPHRGDTIYVFPLGGAGERFPVGGRARVYRSKYAGSSWEELGKGLPDGFYAAVMRDAMCADQGDPAGVYIGSRDGSVYASNDEGESWQVVAEHLPDVLCVRAATL